MDRALFPAYGRVTPFGYRDSEAAIAVEGYEPAKNEQPRVSYNEVGPSYFFTMGIPLISGREFMRADNEFSPLVAIVNETMVRQYWRRLRVCPFLMHDPRLTR